MPRIAANFVKRIVLTDALQLALQARVPRLGTLAMRLFFSFGIGRVIEYVQEPLPDQK